MNKALADYDFFDPEVIEHPFDFYRAAREESPVYLSLIHISEPTRPSP